LWLRSLKDSIRLWNRDIVVHLLSFSPGAIGVRKVAKRGECGGGEAAGGVKGDSGGGSAGDVRVVGYPGDAFVVHVR